MRIWDTDLTITPNYLAQNHVYLLYLKNHLIGYYSYQIESEYISKLDNMFIEPDMIGNGYGKWLMKDLINRSRQLGCHKIILEADPFAVGFYQKLGFKIISQLESSIKNRFLPIMELTLK